MGGHWNLLMQATRGDSLQKRNDRTVQSPSESRTGLQHHSLRQAAPQLKGCLCSGLAERFRRNQHSMRSRPGGSVGELSTR